MPEPVELLIGTAAGVAVGSAAAAALEPALEPAKQQAWYDNPNRILDIGRLARAVAQGLVDADQAAAVAQRHGYKREKFDAMVQLELAGPPVSEALELWRRGLFGEPTSLEANALINQALAKAQVHPDFWTPIKDLFYDRLDPAIIATAIQRGVMKAPFDLPYNPDVPVGKITPFPVSYLDAEEEARSQGVSLERLRVETAIVGLPMALDRAARATFREIIDEHDFLRAVLQGNARGEYAQAELDVAREILTANQYTELELRGFTDRAGRLADTAKHGMSDADSDKLYDVLGRAVAVHAVTTGLARGGNYPGSYANVPEPYRSAIQRSNIREEWAEIAYANRYSYPSGFQIRSEANKGDLTADETNEILLEVGWHPKWAKFFAEKWTAAKVSAGATPATTASKSAIRAVGKSYRDGKLDRLAAEAELVKLGLTSDDWNPLFVAWDVEREATIKSLTPAQVKKAIGSGRYTLPEAIAALEAQGYTSDDALTFLTE